MPSNQNVWESLLYTVCACIPLYTLYLGCHCTTPPWARYMLYCTASSSWIFRPVTVSYYNSYYSLQSGFKRFVIDCCFMHLCVSVQSSNGEDSHSDDPSGLWLFWSKSYVLLLRTLTTCMLYLMLIFPRVCTGAKNMHTAQSFPACRKKRLKKGKRFFAWPPRQRTGLQ